MKTDVESSSKPKWNSQWSRDYYKRKKERDPDYYKTSKKRRRDDNPEKYKSYEQKYKDKHPDRCEKARKKYYNTDKGKIMWRYTANMRRARIKRQKIAEHFRKEIKQLYLACNIDNVIDHIFPLCGKNFCGLHVPWNLREMTQSDNNKKSNKFPDEFIHMKW